MHRRAGTHGDAECTMGPGSAAHHAARAARCAASGARIPRPSSLLQFQTCLHALATQSARAVDESFAPMEGVGNAGCPLHPRPRVHFVLVERTRVTTSTPERPAFPHAMVLTAYVVLSPVTGLFCHRRQRIKVLSKPGRARRNSANLTPASGRQDHTILPSASNISRQRAGDRSQVPKNPPCDPIARKTLPRPPHPIPRS
jgi:hypothetical protein